jgi:hypothetical protein
LGQLAVLRVVAKRKVTCPLVADATGAQALLLVLGDVVHEGQGWVRK